MPGDEWANDAQRNVMSTSSECRGGAIAAATDGLPDGRGTGRKPGGARTTAPLPEASLVRRGSATSTPVTGAADGRQPRSGRFVDPRWTADGEPRATVPMKHLRTLWFNTGTLCNVACKGCYIESSPRNDRLAYLTREEVARFLDEAEADAYGLEEVGFTGGEPFMNPELPGMLEDVMGRGWRTLVLTNAMKPMQKRSADLLSLQRRHADRLRVRVSLDHYTKDGHEAMRGRRSWEPAVAGLKWLHGQGFHVSVASRTVGGESATSLRDGYRALFEDIGVQIPVDDPARLVLFPEMDAAGHVPEISESCWAKLQVEPASMMCASSRMVVKRRGTDRPTVVSCTLLPYDRQFELGETLAQANRPVSLNHRYCAQFCVLGGASCSPEQRNHS
jgi:pyruvate-formate lyase-activating enzyme